MCLRASGLVVCYPRLLERDHLLGGETEVLQHVLPILLSERHVGDDVFVQREPKQD